jgi:hypothetical protein
MLTKIMKWSSAAILLPTLFGQKSEGYLVALQLVVTAGAVLVVWQGFKSKRQLWAIGFAVIAAVYNPFQPMLFSANTLRLFGVLSLATFLVSIVVLKPSQKVPMLSVMH